MTKSEKITVFERNNRRSNGEYGAPPLAGENISHSYSKQQIQRFLFVSGLTVHPLKTDRKKVQFPLLKSKLLQELSDRDS